MHFTLLKQISLFCDLADGEIKAIASHGVLKHVPRNSVLMRQGDNPSALYVVLSGKVRVMVCGDDGKELVLGNLGPREYFGELALIDGEPRSATVTAVEDTELGIISKADFVSCMGNSPEIAISLMRALSKRIRGLNDNLRDFALLDVQGRVDRLLRRLASQHNGELITEPITQLEIASMVGASREMVSRVLNNLKADEVIDMRGKMIAILK
ncbi:MAG TPA: Crp/Fnr family transcriptional regulator [Acidiferrobacteraceae bacterium]|nr:Crp/Fnr family transcriptional regulator [Acidiferrobacteraceae bacterium]